MGVTGQGASYLVGASGEPERPAPDMDWTVQIHKHRSLKDRLTGKNQMTNDDPFSALIEKLIRSEPGFREIEVDRE